MVTIFVMDAFEFIEEADMVLETAEEIIDLVEVAAEAVDMVAEKIVSDLPEGSKLKTTMEAVEDVAETVAGKAQKAIDFIDKVFFHFQTIRLCLAKIS